MKPEDIKGKVSELQGQAKSKIEGAPVPAFFIGVVIGVICADYKEVIVPVVILAVIAYFALIFFAEKTAQSETGESQQ
jgi:uncharacterized membrane protein YoaK (UPF0700 family)